MLINKINFFISETAVLLSCSLQQIYGLIHSGKLLAYKNAESNTCHIPEQSIKDYIDSRMSAIVHKK